MTPYWALLVAMGVAILCGRVGGQTTESSCPEHCLNGHCNVTSLQCTSGCKDGYYGDMCDDKCLPNCTTCDSNTTCTKCMPGLFGGDCSEQCLPNCTICNSTSECLECVSGFYGNACQHECPDHCVSCTDNSTCQECENGYHGDVCSAVCPTSCSSCVNDSLCPSCLDGYYGPVCADRCIDKCATCETGSECTSCDEPYYGPTCSERCPDSCQSCDSDTLCLVCKQNFFNANDHETCTCSTGECAGYNVTTGHCQRCYDGNMYPIEGGCCPCAMSCVSRDCDSRGYCVQGCTSGYFGNRCEFNCKDEDASCAICEGMTSESFRCTVCDQGFFPDNGTCVACSDSCAPDPTGQQANCNATSGACLHGCKERFIGERCQHECDSHCDNGSCVVAKDAAVCGRCVDGYYSDPVDNTTCLACSDHCNAMATADGVTCNFTDGRCYNGCTSGYYDKSCTSKCNDNCEDRICDREDGHCVNGCRVNRVYGDSCGQYCKQGCVGLTCFQNGTCEKGCKGGYHGDLCAETCGNDCDVCSRSSGECTDCAIGYYGDPCRQCSDHCASSDSTAADGTESLCRQEDGGCKYGCQAGWYGEDCSALCSEHCDGGRCERGSGDCPGDCVNGWYGANCTRQCSASCADKQCDKESAECVAGCEESAWFGVFCESRCSVNCASSKCNQTIGVCLDECKDGVCTEGCNDGFHGLNCDKECGSNCSICDRLLGACVNCRTGYYGDPCVPCSEHCSSSPPTGVQPTESLCRQVGGACKYGCDPGWFSDNCSLGCGGHCHGGQCHRENGQCPAGCSVGWYGVNCTASCSVNCAGGECDQQTAECVAGCDKGRWFGAFCDAPCSDNCAGVICNQTSGVCTEGCKEGFTGETCDTLTPEEPETPVTMIASVVGGCIALLLILTIVVLYLTRRKRGRATRAISQNLQNLFSGKNRRTRIGSQLWLSNPGFTPGRDGGDQVALAPLGDVEEEGAEWDEDLPEAERAHVNVKQVPVSRLLPYIRAKTEADYIVEFSEIPDGLQRPHDEAEKRDNYTKNCYKDILPYDDNRVLLKGGDSSYINASLIKGFSKTKNLYIASQGPTKNTVKDFWQMVWQESSAVIVMLTNLEEGERTTCDKYWPEVGDNMEQGDITVSCESEAVYTGFTVRVLSITKALEKRAVTQLQLTSWGDREVPDTVTDMVEFHQKFRRLRDPDHEAPSVVHCSAGVGRTGVFIALDVLLDQGRSTGHVNIQETVITLREQRVNLVQNMAQYVFLHKVVIQSLVLDCRLVKKAELPGYYTHRAMTLDGDISLMEKDLKMLSRSLMLDDRDLESMKRNKTFTKKNREYADIPDDKYRPVIEMVSKKTDTDYINAVYVDGSKRKEALILTHFPLPDTVGDFFRLVYQSDTACIVVMETMDIKDKTQVALFPKREGKKKYGKITVSSSSGPEEGAVYDRLTITITSAVEGWKGQKDVTVFLYKDWLTGNQTVPADETSLLALIGDVRRCQESEDDSGPIVSTCLNGADHCGLFCLMYLLLEKLDREGHVSVVNTLRQLKARRPGVIPNLEQYRFCHEVINAYLDRKADGTS